MKRVVGGKGEETPEAHTQGVEDLKGSFDPHLRQEGCRGREGKERHWHTVVSEGQGKRRTEVGREPVNRSRVGEGAGPGSQVTWAGSKPSSDTYAVGPE